MTSDMQAPAMRLVELPNLPQFRPDNDKVRSSIIDFQIQSADVLASEASCADVELIIMSFVSIKKLFYFQDSFCDLTALKEHLLDEYLITAVCVHLNDRNWVRLSANVYNTIEDYEKLRDAVLAISQAN